MAVDDIALEGQHIIKLTHEVTGASGRFSGIPAPVDIVVEIEDNDKGGLMITAGESEVDEGVSIVMQVRLTERPPDNFAVRVDIYSSSSQVSLSPTSVRFEGTDGGAWNVNQTITVTFAFDGGFALGDRGVDITASTTSLNSVYNGITAAVPTITIRDLEDASITIRPENLELTEGGTRQFTVKLNSRPTAPVTITVDRGVPITVHPGLGLAELPEFLVVNPTKLIISSNVDDWREERTITVEYRKDSYVTGNFDRSLSLSLAGKDTTGYDQNMTIESVNVNVADVDSAGVTISSTVLTIEEGTSGDYTFTLGSIPYAGVVITAQVLPEGRLEPKSSRFIASTNKIEQTIDALRDFKQIGDKVYTVTHSIASEDPTYRADSFQIPSVTVTVTDPDVAALLVQGSDGAARTSITVEEGGAAQGIIVKLATAPTDDVVVHVSEVQDKDDDDPAVAPIMLLNGESSTIVRTFASGELPQREPELPDATVAIPLEIDITRTNNDEIDGLLTTWIRISIENAGGDNFYGDNIKIPPIFVEVTVRDDEAVAVEAKIAASSTEVAEISDGNVVVTFPAGALTETKDISVLQLPTKNLQAAPFTETLKTKSLVVQYGPPGTTFEMPVTITVPLDDGDCLDTTKHCQFLYRAGNDASDGDWAIMPGANIETVPDVTKPGAFVTVARLNVTHFSLYTVVAIEPGVELSSKSGIMTSTAWYTEGSSKPVAVAPNLQGKATIDGTEIVEVKATVVAPTYVVGEDALSFIGAICTRALTEGDATCSIPGNPTTGFTFALTADWQVSSGTLTVRRAGGSTGGGALTMTPVEAGKVLAGIAYSNPSRTPTLKNREISFTVVEQWTSLTSPEANSNIKHIVTIVPVNDPPIILLSSEVLPYTEGQISLISPALTLTLKGVDSTTLTSASIWLEPAEDGDMLWVLDGNGITTQEVNTNRSLDTGYIEQNIDSTYINYVGDSMVEITIKPNEAAPLAHFQEVLRRLAYNSTNKNPISLNRTLWIEVTDDVSADMQTWAKKISRTVTKATARAYRNITITPVNDPPKMREENMQFRGQFVDKVKAIEDEGPVGIYELIAEDPEYDPVTFRISCAANKGQVQLLNETSGAFNFTPALNEYTFTRDDPDSEKYDLFAAVATDSYGYQSAPQYYNISIEGREDTAIAG